VGKYSSATDTKSGMVAPQKTKNGTTLKFRNRSLEEERVTCTPMFSAALVTIAKLWKQLTHLTPEEWVKNEIMLFAGKWKNWRTSC
jgi:hypothetical protein